MGRMFRIITEGGSEPLDRPAPVALAAETVPFVEVGGPEGVITSIRPTVVRVTPPPAAEPAPEPEPPAPTVPAYRALSVSFHRFPRAGLRTPPGGVAEDVVAFHDPNHPVATEYRAVRDEARRQFEEEGPRVVLFTAAAPAAGTTTVVLNLAVALTQDGGGRVLVVDANFDRPAVARRLGVPDSPGLAEVLGQSVPLTWALQPSAVPDLHVLAGGVPTDGTAAAMDRDFPRLLAQLRQWFDWVLVDVGVWSDALGSEVVGPAGDAVYLVTRHADQDRPEFTGLRAAVAAAGGVPRGFVTTQR